MYLTLQGDALSQRDECSVSTDIPILYLRNTRQLAYIPRSHWVRNTVPRARSRNCTFQETAFWLSKLSKSEISGLILKFFHWAFFDYKKKDPLLKIWGFGLGRGNFLKHLTEGPTPSHEGILQKNCCLWLFFLWKPILITSLSLQ